MVQVEQGRRQTPQTKSSPEAHEDSNVAIRLRKTTHPIVGDIAAMVQDVSDSAAASAKIENNI